ncbi:Listeria/Bacterioides repeat [Syntrophomonas zehnderi OL-4]|uniref:Listeria/Bacterioides repeat n=1 Tax=Syntrophomonas zehnderi OL-4 TaxID=690567 RepID=A0A0E4G9N2_9FIRM|nr:S-layer homology domain-containing protein [Syntrophomonas zehnderi]CFX17866.1 Listeria/Bacterioides repeat [Syntrophomonas zehnderi OL-4]
MLSTSSFTPNHNTDYDLYVILRDDADNLSTPVKVDVKSPPAANFIAADYLKAGETQPDGSKQVQIQVQVQGTDQKGKVYWVLLPNDATAPTVDEVGKGTSSGGEVPVSSGSQEFEKNTPSTFLVTGAQDATAYDLYLVVGDTQNFNPLAECTDVFKLDVTTPAAGAPAFEVVGGNEHQTLSVALGEVGNNGTIKLLRTANTTDNITLLNKTITLDLNSFDLNISSPADEGIKVTNGTLAVTGAGKLNATGKLYGVWANKGTVTVDDAASGDGIGVYAILGANVTVRGNATGQSNGVYADNIYTKVTVKGNVTSTTGQIQGAVYALGQAEVIVEGDVSASSGYGVHTNNSGVITVNGDVTASRGGALTEGTGGEITVKDDLSSYNHCAVITQNSSGNITVEGAIKPLGKANYVLINNVPILKEAGVSDPGKSGYLKYSGSGATGLVWVRDPSVTPAVCEIVGGAQYDNLPAALAAASDGQHIRLLQSIVHEKSIEISGAKTIYLQMNNHDLTIRNTGNGPALEVGTSSKVWVGETGNLTLDAKFAALNVSYGEFHSGGAVNATLQSAFSPGINADNAIVEIEKGTLTSESDGIYASESSTIAFNGPVTVNGKNDNLSNGVHLSGIDNTVSVNGNVHIASGQGTGVYVEDGGTVTVGHTENPVSITSTNSSGIWTRQGSNTADITVYGTVTGKARAIDATGDADIKVLGDVKSTSTLASLFAVEGFANSGDTIAIAITGNVEGPNGVKYHGNDGTISVTGNVTATGSAGDTVGVFASYGSVSVTGNVAAPNGIGAEAGENGEITIDGKLSGKVFAKVYYTIKTENDKTLPTTKPGYHTYSKDTAIVWVKESTSLYNVAVNGSYAVITGAGSYAQGTVITINAGTRSGYSFTGWTSPDGVVLENAKSATTTFSMPAKNVSVTATWSYNGGGSVGGGGGSSSPSAPTINAVVKAGTYTENYPIAIDKAKNSSTANLNLDDCNAAFENAQTGSDGSKSINITFPPIQDINSCILGLPVSALSSQNANRNISMSSSLGVINLPGNMLQSTGLAADDNIAISISKADNATLPESVRDIIGDRPVTELRLTKGGQTIAWDNPAAPVAVTIPYTPTKEELLNPEHITVWYIDGKGNVVAVPSGRYDSATGTVTFRTTHFSKYAVVYASHNFDDLGSVGWAKKPIEVLASKGVLKGISENKYAPETNITRADFLYYLVRTLDLDAKFDGNFEDIKPDAYYYQEMGIAKKLGITSGTGNNRYSPEVGISRQDMMVLTDKALRMLKNQKEQGKASDLERFKDKSLIAGYAINSVATVVKEGLITGSNNLIKPLDNTSRAEAAVFLYKIYNKY